MNEAQEVIQLVNDDVSGLKFIRFQAGYTQVGMGIASGLGVIIVAAVNLDVRRGRYDIPT